METNHRFKKHPYPSVFWGPQLVWDIVVEDLDLLKAQLETILETEFPSGKMNAGRYQKRGFFRKF